MDCEAAYKTLKTQFQPGTEFALLRNKDKAFSDNDVSVMLTFILYLLIIQMY